MSVHNNGEQSKVQKEAQPSRSQAVTPLEVASFRALVTFCFLTCVLMVQVRVVCEGSSASKLLLLCARQHVSVIISNVFKRMVLALHL